jgi:hypothetical protein
MIDAQNFQIAELLKMISELKGGSGGSGFELPPMVR